MLAASGLGNQQLGDVGARYQQEKSSRTEQDQHDVSGLSHGLFLERRNTDGQMAGLGLPVGIGVFRSQRYRKSLGFATSLLHCDAWSETADDSQRPAGSARGVGLGVDRQGQPHSGRLHE